MIPAGSLVQSFMVTQPEPCEWLKRTMLTSAEMREPSSSELQQLLAVACGPLLQMQSVKPDLWELSSCGCTAKAHVPSIRSPLAQIPVLYVCQQLHLFAGSCLYCCQARQALCLGRSAKVVTDWHAPTWCCLFAVRSQCLLQKHSLLI